MKNYTDPIGEFTARVQAKLKEGRGDRQAAIYAVTRADPDLHRQYIVASNDALGKHVAVDGLRR